ncbi:MAG: hypothetical protein BWY63_03897 [Chloroflexi bacterium ADurb.Bin360]|nr:MAG: hypothetical protein BWY63_03897 [Chloroflexi bacterium ADurb.Bin360]
MRVRHPLAPPFLQFRFRRRRRGFAVDLEHQHFAMTFRSRSGFKPRARMPSQSQDHRFDAIWGWGPVQEHGQDRDRLGITHFCGYPCSQTLDQHTKAVAGQPWFHIQGIIPTAFAVEISAPIANLPKESPQQSRFGIDLLIPWLWGRCLKLLFAHTEKELDKPSFQCQDFGHQVGLEREEGERLTGQHPLHQCLHFLGDTGSHIFYRGGGGNIVWDFYRGSKQTRLFHWASSTRF